MEQWRKDARNEIIMIDLEALVPKDHLLRKIEKVMDYEWLYERLEPYYCHDNGRPGTDPVVLIKMVLIQHLFGIPSLRQTYQRIQDTLSYRWFLGYGLLDEIPHFATVSYAFCKRFPEELTQEIFEHILNKALNNRMVDPSTIFIDGTHIKASANKKKFQKQRVAETSKVYSEQLRKEVNAEREKLGKKPIEDDDSSDDNDENPPTGGGSREKTISTTDPDSGMFVKGEHERQFAYEAHTACDSRGFVLGVEVTAGNVHDSVAWDNLYDAVTHKHKVQFVTMDAGYKTPWIAKKTIEDGKVRFFPTQDTRAGRIDISPGNTPMTLPMTRIYVRREKAYGIRPRTGMGNESTGALPSGAETALAEKSAEQMNRDRRYTQHISGRSIWI